MFSEPHLRANALWHAEVGDRMRVLHFITTLDRNSGGPSRSVPRLCQALSEAGVDVTLAFSDDGRDLSSETIAATVECRVIRIATKPQRNLVVADHEVRSPSRALETRASLRLPQQPSSKHSGRVLAPR